MIPRLTRWEDRLGGLVPLISAVDNGLEHGLFSVEDGRLVPLPAGRCASLATDGERLARLVPRGSVLEQNTIQTFDRNGLLTEFPASGTIEAHDIHWAGDEIVVVSTGDNRIVWFGADGGRRREVRLPGRGDAWHVNCLITHEGRLLASAFGRFGDHREWGPRLEQRTGMIFDVHDGREVLEGLAAPHHPRVVDGTLVVCNSLHSTIAGLDPATGEPLREAALGGFPRGLAVAAGALLVGLSAHRHSREGIPQARVAVLDRTTWKPLAEVPVPVQELYDIVLVPPELLHGLRAGLEEHPDPAPVRLAEPCAPLANGDRRVTIELPAWPSSLPADDRVVLPCHVFNRGSVPLSSAGPDGVFVTARWTGLTEQSRSKTPLEGTLVPGASAAGAVDLLTPADPGVYELAVTMEQRDVPFDASSVVNAQVVITRVPTTGCACMCC
jgi:hypothetical protein